MTSRTLATGLLLLLPATACTRYQALPPMEGRETGRAGSLDKAPAASVIAGPPAAAHHDAQPTGRQAGAMTTESFRRSASGQPVDPISYLAYAYAVSLELPGEHLARTMDAHAAACREAGPRVCQLVTAQRGGDAAIHVRGELSLRAEPRWLQRFMTGVEGDARGAGGRVVSKSTTTEDLTRAIIDTEAALRAKKALRERLEQLLASRPGKLADFLDVERELARVQGEIDSTESNLAAMRTRVAMSSLTVQYESRVRAVAGDTFAPLGRALAGFIGNVVNGVAAILTLVAVGLPWMVVGVPIAWLIVRACRRAKAMGRPAPLPMTVEPPAAPAS
jgi:hypothetical protein